MNVIEIGSYPPPFGGVSIHIQRLTDYLNSNGMRCCVIDILGNIKADGNRVSQFSRFRAVLKILTARRSILHFHDFYFESSRLGITYLLMQIFGARHIRIQSFHNERFPDRLNGYGKWRRNAAVYFLNRMHKIIVDNPLCAEMAARFITDKSRIAVIPEFIPPRAVPPVINSDILNLRKEKKFLISSNAWQICFHKGEDLYGIDMLVELVDRLANRRKIDVGLVFLLPSVGDAEYLKRINEEINRRGIEDRFLIVTEPLEEAASLWNISDAVIRATNTDGNSVSVLEALSMKIPVVASDCTVRPEGAVLF